MSLESWIRKVHAKNKVFAVDPKNVRRFGVLFIILTLGSSYFELAHKTILCIICSYFTQFKNRPYSEEMWMILSERARVDKIKKMVIEHYLEIYDLVELSLPEEPHLLLKIKSK